MLAVCQRCARPITVPGPGWNDCKFCSGRIWVADPQGDDRLPQQPVGQTKDDRGWGQPPCSIPWESAEGGNAFVRFWKTVWLASFRISQFSQRLTDSSPIGKAQVFGLTILTAGLFLHFQVQALSFRFFKLMLQGDALDPDLSNMVRGMIESMEQLHITDRFFLISSMMAPLFALLILWLTSAVFSTASSLVLKENAPSRNRILRAVVYGYCPWLLIFMPPLGVVWTVICHYRLLKDGAGFSRVSSFFTALANFFFLNFVFDLWIRVHAWLS